MDRPPTLTDAVAKAIRDRIMRGDFGPGDALHEIELSKSLEISRGTVREALRVLHKEMGLVDIIPHRGAFVTKLSIESVQEIYTLRALLEPYAVRLAMESKAYTEEDLHKMETLVRHLGELESVPGAFYSESVETDMAFHQMTSQRCNHKLLLGVLDNLRFLTVRFILCTKLYRSDMVPDSVSHQAILDGIRRGDPLAAEEIVRKHITDAGSSLANRMKEVNWGESSGAHENVVRQVLRSA